LGLNASIDRSQPAAPQYIGRDIQFPGANANALIAYPLAPADAQSADWSPANVPRSNNRFLQASLRGDYSLSDDLTLTSISSYINYNRDMQAEYGGTASQADELYADIGYIGSYFQELRIANNPGDALRWLLGVNYDYSRVNDFNGLNFPGSTIVDALGVTGTPFYSDQRMRNYATFTNADWDLNEQVTLKAGARFTRSERHDKSCALGTPGGIDALFDSLVPALHGGASFPPLQPQDCVSLDPTTLLPVRQGFIADLNESNVSWRTGVDYKPTSSSLIYVNVSKGFKAGSFPTVAASTTYQFQPVKQESVLDYEAGFKQSLFGRTVQLNGAVFHYDYANKQIRSQTVQPIFGLLNNLVNVPKSTVDGAELEIYWQPLPGLRLGLSGTYLDAKITSYTGTNGAGITRNYAGDAVPYTPKITAAATADYRRGLTDRLDVSAGATWSHRSESFAVIGPTLIDRINPYDLMDFRVGVETKDDRYGVQVWGRNVTNKYYWNNVVHVYDTITRYAEMPATYGVRLSIRY
jgi:iron complex outermembrane recepter protein